jgi:hypothetical protein
VKGPIVIDAERVLVGAVHRFESAGELYKHIVACGVDQSSAVGLNTFPEQRTGVIK